MKLERDYNHHLTFLLEMFTSFFMTMAKKVMMQQRVALTVSLIMVMQRMFLTRFSVSMRSRVKGMAQP